ncbi:MULTISPECIES: RHS repeat-associated core domain-containing protein [unclassified Pseudoclavibacter]|uniref:RHS repeat-associated core domain-containing protein n=1 Tax=unclassified Pseudoclavibacter TaxID=2615177 RepID=UPI0017878270|nr:MULTISPECIES: RHS repeat-associated core domain-containing protein [unclassified Pseudoclavibacter]
MVTGPAGLVGTAAGWGGATARQTRSFAADPWAVPDWQTSDAEPARTDMSTPAQGGQAPGGQTPGGQVFGGQVPGGRAGSLPAVGLPAGVSLSGAGSVVFSGMEWMGARVYDPATRGFLAVDPVPGVPGAGWQTNAYAYAGNNPVGMSDPSGLAPLSDADLAAWDDAHHGAIAAVGDWWNDNWEYVAAGAAIAVGVGLMFTGVGGPVGAVLIGAASGAFISAVWTESDHRQHRLDHRRPRRTRRRDTRGGGPSLERQQRRGHARHTNTGHEHVCGWREEWRPNGAR